MMWGCQAGRHAHRTRPACRLWTAGVGGVAHPSSKCTELGQSSDHGDQKRALTNVVGRSLTVLGDTREEQLPREVFIFSFGDVHGRGSSRGTAPAAAAIRRM